MKLSDFYFELPDELIAQEPLADRSASKLMIVHKNSKEIEHKTFKNILDLLHPGDCLVINNTRVIPARLIGEKEETGSKVEFLLLNRLTVNQYEVMVKPGKKAKVGATIVFGNGKLTAKVLEVAEGGNRIVEFQYEGVFEQVLDELGQMPLPPYIHHTLEDKERYQTVYSKYKGSAAAPTAGLHFTPELLQRIRDKGIQIAEVTLHVGLGTFRPVKVENVLEHKMHAEYYQISDETAKLINETKANGGRIIAVGTTSCRTLESAAVEKGLLQSSQGWTDIFIYPGYPFKIVDAMITNFHLPESTLIMLVSALAGKETIMHAYESAVKEKYRFFSFGDAMFIQ